MNKTFIFIGLFGLLIFSCKKSNTEPQTITPQKTESLKDLIVYSVLKPFTEIQTVRFYTLQDHQVCSISVPTPTDSSTQSDLDIDNDKVLDFRISIRHFKNSQSCGHCDNYMYSISIQGLSINDSIASRDQYLPKFYNVNEVVDKNNKWLSRAEFLGLGSCEVYSYADFIKGYIGVKIKNSFGYIYVEKLQNNGIRIVEYGFNKTENNAIKCGQK
jgi:hypothetical protein